MKSDGDPYYSWCFCINYPIVTPRNSFVHVQKEKKETGCKVMLNMFKLEQCQLVPVFFFCFFFFFLLILINSYNMQHIKLMLFRLTKHYFYQLDKKISGVIFISTFMIQRKRASTFDESFLAPQQWTPDCDLRYSALIGEAGKLQYFHLHYDKKRCW